jgi:FkbM family methyltransferase
MYPPSRDPQLSPHLARLITHPIDEVRKGRHDKDNALHFRAFASAIAQQCRSLLLQEAWILWRTNAKEGGYFVELGAGDGLNRSNTCLLEWSYKWSGVVADAHPELAELLRRNRSCFVSSKCVYSRTGEAIDFMAARDRRLSRIAAIDALDSHETTRSRDFKLVSVESVSLSDLLAEAGAPADIDYISMDTEGSEPEILRHFDFRKWNVRLLTVNHDFSPRRNETEDILGRNGYTRIWKEIAQSDDWYVKNADQFAA